VRQQIGLGIGEQVGDGGEPRAQALEHGVDLAPCRPLAGLLDHQADRRPDHAPRAARHEVLGLAGEVGAAPLPGRSEELLADDPSEPGVVVADDEPHAAQPALDEAPDERGPGGALVVAGRQKSSRAESRCSPARSLTDSSV
jgi:hypothetical protein